MPEDEEDEEEIQEAKEISMNAALATVSSELGSIFTTREDEEK